MEDDRNAIQDNLRAVPVKRIALDNSVCGISVSESESTHTVSGWDSDLQGKSYNRDDGRGPRVKGSIEALGPVLSIARRASSGGRPLTCCTKEKSTEVSRKLIELTVS